ncbi:hypothetical protein QYF36_010401 [Acer negundo]|nr:hypothetical protein QYF36_010401 [Acer negundo]
MAIDRELDRGGRSTGGVVAVPSLLPSCTPLGRTVGTVGRGEEADWRGSLTPYSKAATWIGSWSKGKVNMLNPCAGTVGNAPKITELGEYPPTAAETPITERCPSSSSLFVRFYIKNLDRRVRIVIETHPNGCIPIRPAVLKQDRTSNIIPISFPSR